MKYLGKISSNINQLNILHKKYNWIPNMDEIRPSENIIKDKEEYIQMMKSRYGSIKNGIICDVFNLDHNNIIPQKKFIKNRFSYAISSNHYIMWYLLYNKDDLSDDIINIDIYCNIYQILCHTNFDFAWYVNPKMTIPDIFHVQIFWINKN
jgi:hypothetical protein